MTEPAASGSSSTVPLRRLRIERLDPKVVEILRRTSPQERWEMAFRAHEQARSMLACHFRELHPAWDDDQINAAVAQRLLRG